jgi:serine/threonine protein kinase
MMKLQGKKSNLENKENLDNKNTTSKDKEVITFNNVKENKMDLVKNNKSKNYNIIKNIGNGNYGQVFLAINEEEKIEYAIKKVNLKEINSKDKENLENEIKLLEDLQHPNIISCKESFKDEKENLNIVTTYCEGGNMYSMIRNQKGVLIEETVILDYIVQIGLALSYIHDKKILHRDLKTENIFLKGKLLKIGDFGIAKEYSKSKIPSESVRTIINNNLF